MSSEHTPVFFAAQPSASVRAALIAEPEQSGVIAQLGWRLFDELNWHQSLSVLFDASPKTIAALLKAGDEVQGTAFVMTFNRLRSDPRRDAFLWTFRAQGIPAGFEALKSRICQCLQGVGVQAEPRNAPHITISYKAQNELPTTPITPVDWLVDELLLLRGGGAPYRYTVLGRWPLAPPPPEAVEQLALFG